MAASLSYLACYTKRCSSAREGHDSNRTKMTNLKLNGTSSRSYLACYTIRCSSAREGHDSNRTKMTNLKLNGTSSISGTSTKIGVVTTSIATDTENGHISAEQLRQNIPTKKQFVDTYRQGEIIEGGVGYRQTIVIRSYEVGPDKTATIDTVLNLLQETALNHVWMSGLLGDGFGATHGMVRNNLIWVVSRMQVQVDHYPIWNEVMELDTWVGASGKNGMRRDWELRSRTTGLVFARATSTWVMMNKTTRRLSKMPDEVRSEIGPWFIEKRAIEEDAPEKIEKLDENAKYVSTNLKPKRSDLDMNQHVNNVKYVGWMLETIPEQFLEDHQLTNISLEYRKECKSSDIVQSFSDPDEVGMINRCQPKSSEGVINGFSLPSEILEGNGLLGSSGGKSFRYTHLLQANGEHKNEEIVRGRTTWKKRISTRIFPI